MLENLNELIDEAERACEAASRVACREGGQLASDIYGDPPADHLDALAWRDMRIAEDEESAEWLRESWHELGMILAAYRAIVAECDKLAAELDRLRAQAERYRLDALRLAAKVDPEEFAAEWEAEIADLRTVREDLDNERAVRSRRELAVNRAIAHANKYRHPGTNAGDHRVLSEIVEILEGSNTKGE